MFFELDEQLPALKDVFEGVGEVDLRKSRSKDSEYEVAASKLCFGDLSGLTAVLQQPPPLAASLEVMVLVLLLFLPVLLRILSRHHWR